jgi:hypothetical protein
MLGRGSPALARTDVPGMVEETEATALALDTSAIRSGGGLGLESENFTSLRNAQ